MGVVSWSDTSGFAGLSVSGHLIVGQPLLDGQTGLVVWFDGFREPGSTCELVIPS